MRARNNAFKHGLATPVSATELANDIDDMARYLTGFSNDFARTENAKVVAEAQFDLVRIRAARAEVFRRLGDPEECCDGHVVAAVDALEKIARYEKRTRSKLRQGFRALAETERSKNPK